MNGSCETHTWLNLVVHCTSQDYRNEVTVVSLMDKIEKMQLDYNQSLNDLSHLRTRMLTMVSGELNVAVCVLLWH